MIDKYERIIKSAGLILGLLKLSLSSPFMKGGLRAVKDK